MSIEYEVLQINWKIIWSLICSWFLH